MKDQDRNALGKRTKQRAFDRATPDGRSTEQTVPSLRDACLDKKISYFPPGIKDIPSGDMSVKTFLLNCKLGKYQMQIEAIRAETDKEKQSTLKKRLPAVTLQSEPCTQRSKENCKSNGLVCLDFDNIGNLAEAKRKIASVPYVLAVFTSARGNGVFAVCVLREPAKDLKPIMEAMQKDFKYPIDKSCSDVSRLRYVTYDPEPIEKVNITPFVLPSTTDKITRQAEVANNEEHRIDRAKAYIAKMPPAISGQRGHNAALNVANALHNFGLTEDEAIRIFKEDYNSRCEPEWSDKEIYHKINDAFNKPLNTHGSKLWESVGNKFKTRQAKNGKPSVKNGIKTRLKLTLKTSMILRLMISQKRFASNLILPRLIENVRIAIITKVSMVVRLP